jgi:hypothetical protein
MLIFVCSERAKSSSNREPVRESWRAGLEWSDLRPRVVRGAPAMNVVIFGATGMVGQSVLRECLLDSGVEHVLTIGRKATGQSHAKLRELTLSNLTDYSAVGNELQSQDACFFCLGVTSAGMSEEAYRRVTRDIPAAAGKALAEKNPNLTFVLVTGAGSDETGMSSTMWRRVKGEAENAVLELPCHGKYVFRPAIIQPLHGVKSRTFAYRAFYTLSAPAFPLLKKLYPERITTSERVGRAMLNVARRGFPKSILESADIDAAGE